ncbi:MAG TPA: flagellar filament capping protein FliD, partial [Clostridiales bacterium]|nr:flagellar filament capping protein FliD [Clostridiales bacterium]
MRITGMVSGLDTDSLVKELVSAQKMKNKKIEDKKVKLEWQQDIWKTLNSKLFGFFSDGVSKVRLEGNYQNKKVDSSNDKAIEVRGNNAAPLGVHEVTIKEIASSQYITSGIIETGSEDGKVTNDTKLSSLVDLTNEENATLIIADKTLNITEDTKISDVVNMAREAGLNANFDEEMQRLFISSKESGEVNSFQIRGSVSVLSALSLDALDETGAKIDSESNRSSLVQAKDSIIVYNGAELRGNTNVITANGLTFTLKDANPEETIKLNVGNDSESTYDMIKDFIKGYNEVLGEMNTRYNASSARGYAPLTEEEKDTLADGTVEKWETTIKDSLLRRDSGLGSLINSFRSIASKGVEVDGKTYTLSSFGINTSDYTERGLLHIYGDEDDPTYSSNDDKLLKAIEEDPELVMKVFSEIGKELHSTMSDKMSSVPNVKSAMTFYNDKLMSKELSRYEKEISVLDRKLYEMEERYYNQFSRLETALSQ